MRAVIFDLDGTRVDTVYGQTLAWQRVLEQDALSSLDALDLPKTIVVVDRDDGGYRVYSNPAELLSSIYQLGLRAS